MPKPKTAEHFITIGTRKQILSATSAYPEHELLHNQIAISFDEYTFLKSYSLEKAKRIIKSIEVKIKKGH